MNSSDVVIHSLDSDLSEKHVVAGYSDGAIKLYNLNDNKLTSLVDLPGHSAPVTKAVFAGNGDIIVSADFSGKLIVWKLENGIFGSRVNMQVVAGPVYDVAPRKIGDCLTVFCGCDGGVFKTLTFDKDFNVSEESQDVHRFGISAVSCNDTAIVTGGFEYAVALHTAGKVERFKHHTATVTAVAVAPNNHLNKLVFASCSEDGTVVVTEQRDGEFVHQTINIGEPCYSLGWNRSGLVLTVGFGRDKLKSFILGISGEYEEIQMSEADN